MIEFDKGSDRFNYRVVGVAVHDDSVLLHQEAGDDFWTLPGGRAEFGETASETLRREMLEELGVEVEVVRLLWLVENFFDHAGKRYHEIALYFLMRLPAGCEYLSRASFRSREEDGTQLTFQWFARQPELLSTLSLFPSFLRTAIQTLPESVQHVVERS